MKEGEGEVCGGEGRLKLRMKESLLAAASTSPGWLRLGRASVSVCVYVCACLHACAAVLQLNRGYFI